MRLIAWRSWERAAQGRPLPLPEVSSDSKLPGRLTTPMLARRAEQPNWCPELVPSSFQKEASRPAQRAQPKGPASWRAQRASLLEKPRRRKPDQHSSDVIATAESCPIGERTARKGLERRRLTAWRARERAWQADLAQARGVPRAPRLGWKRRDP